MSERTVTVSDGPVRVHFRDIHDPYNDGYGFRSFTVELSDQGMSASTVVVTMEAGDGLAAFVTSLAEDWNGWDGTRKWRAIESGLHIEAEHEATGKVHFRLEIWQSPYPGAWTASVRISMFAGEDLLRFAEDVRRFCE